jgi:hypothetical protein
MNQRLHQLGSAGCSILITFGRWNEITLRSFPGSLLRGLIEILHHLVMWILQPAMSFLVIISFRQGLFFNSEASCPRLRCLLTEPSL